VVDIREARQQAIPEEPILRGQGRERILDEARARFLDQGYNATSMQEIADAIGMTKPALYYHFRDKQELLLAVIAREMETGKRAFLEILTTSASLEDRLAAGAIWCFRSIRGDMGRMMSDMHRVLPSERVMAFKSSHLQPADMVQRILDIGVEQGEVSASADTASLARMYIGMIFGQLQMQCGDEIQQINPEPMGKLVAAVFMHGISGQ